MKHKKRALLKSALSLLLCVAMLTGTTFAWFTDSVVSGYNTIAAGNLDVALYHSNAAVTDEPVDSTTKLFMDLQGNPILWEPGVVSYENLRVTNEGDLALAYQLSVNTANENYIVDPSGAQYGLSQALKVGVVEGGITTADRAGILESVKETGWYTLESFLRGGALLPEGEGVFEKTWGVVIYWEPGENDNLLNLNNGKQLNEGDVLSIDLGIKLVATQEGHESDVFGDDYDSDAKAEFFPDFVGGTSSIPVVVNEQYQTVSESVKTFGKVTVTVPAGVQLTTGTTALPVSIGRMGGSNANVELGENEILRSLDVHVGGVSGDNRTPITVSLQEAAPKGLNMGNYKLFHVEADGTKEMTLVDAADAFTAHNQFKYDPATGDLTLYMASFSEVAVVADTENAWEGNRDDYRWYDADATELTIANADQLAAFGAIVGGMDGQTADSFSGQTVKLINDINIGDITDGNGMMFYPIGYYNSNENYVKVSGGSISSGFKNFEGTFDGNGHTVSNFYQNTWEAFGDYNDGYSGTPNHNRDGFGLFGRVYKGTVKNLTVKNFSSDGEFATTGTIAAYADGATFENIAIFDCNPRVYNIGNGGIVGCVGWYAKDANLKTTFSNITVDNSNKITALWGSWDVACGGIVGQYYPTSGQTSAGQPANGGIHFENCHVSAQIDVYNDVCANYQYYAYRYAGILMGSVRENVTIDGSVYPKMDKITAEDCTVHFGDWNVYYYCELVANSLASYTHDHQMSRLEKISSLDEIKSGNNWTKAGNFLLIDGNTKTCYHIVNKDGVLTQHNHADAGEETVDGVTVLKEDKQIVCLPFNNLVTGYGWGVTSKGVGQMDGVTILDREVGDSEVKFVKADNAKDSYTTGSTVTIGELFKAAEIDDKKLTIKGDKVQVTVSPVDENSTAGGTYVANTTDWTQGTLTFSGTGDATVTITDYYFCTPTTIEVTITDRVAEEKFEKKFDKDFLYRVGNKEGSTVALGTLFIGKNVTGAVAVSIENVAGNANGGYTSNTTWTNGTIQFSGTGVVKVTITDNDYCIPTELYLEVVDAVNATTATKATANNVVLLNDCGFGSLEVSGGYALYGNGFTMTCASDSAALDMGYSFVTLNNGTLDNVQIVCPNFDYAVLYKSNLDDMPDDRTQTTDRTRYYNVKSGVMASGNSQILNSRISGGRAAVNVTGGNCVIDNSRIELGAVASILVGSANSLTLRDVTLVQKPTASTYDRNKTLMGFSVLVMCDAKGDSAPITLEGKLIQNAWVNESHKKYVPSSGQSIVDTALTKTDFLHDIDGNGTKESLNLGFAYMPDSISGPVKSTTISNNDNRDNKDQVPYEIAEISLGMTSANTYVYSYKNTKGTDADIKNEGTYKPDAYGEIIDVIYSDTQEGLTFGKTFGTDGWVYELNVDLDKLSGYKLDFSKLCMRINGVEVTDFRVNGGAKPAPISVTAGGVTYTLTATIDGKVYTTTYKVTGTETSKESPSKISGPTATGFGVAKSYGKDWSGAADVLTGVKVKYWSVAEHKYVEFDFSNFAVPGNAGKLNGTNNYWEYTHTNNDFTLKVTNTVAIHSGNSVYGMPIRGTDGKLYFTISSTNGYVGTGTKTRAITMQYEFTDNNGGEKLTFTHTFNISYNKDDQYSYSDLSGSGTLTKLGASSGGGGCVTGDTMITLADGSKKMIKNVAAKDTLRVWNFYEGKYDYVPAATIINHGSEQWDVITLTFDDGTVVKAVTAHAFFDADLNKFVMITPENTQDYIGHAFAKEATNGYSTTKLISCKVEKKYTDSYSLVSALHYNFTTEGMFSLTNLVPNLIAGLEIGKNMKYDEVALKKDIVKYGLYTYADFAEYITEETFDAFNAQYIKISVGEGYITYEEIIDLIARFVNN